MTGKKPNIFKYATKELSLDAVVCWLIKWAGQKQVANKEDEALRDCGRRLVEALLRKHKPRFKLPREVQIDGEQQVTFSIKEEKEGSRRQSKRIDILVRVGDQVLLIEDKTDGVANTGQLVEYYNAVVLGEGPNLERGEVLVKMTEGVASDNIYPIFLKTGNFVYEDMRVRCDTPYETFTRQDFLKVLGLYKGRNAILTDFRDYLQKWENETNAWEKLGTGDWLWNSWQGFCGFLVDKRSFTGLHYVNNRSGGFLCCWWGDDKEYEHQDAAGYGIKMYPQLEIGSASDPAEWKLCFKLITYSFDEEGRSLADDIKGDIRRHIRDTMRVAIGGDSEAENYKLAHRTTTKSITVARWNKDNAEDSWLVSDDSGQVDMNRTVRNMREAARFFARIVEQVVKNDPKINLLQE